MDTNDDRQIFASDSAEAARTIDEESLSVLVLSWTLALEPHLTALAALTEPAAPESIDVSPRENAHAVAASAIAYFLLESKRARLQAIGHPTSLQPDLDVRVLEVEVLRNVLVHNHVWDVLVRRSWEDWSQPGELLRAEPRYGDVERRAYLQAIEPGTRHTRILGLHLMPSEVRRSDVVRVLSVVTEALDALNEHDVPNMRSPADHSVQIDGHLTPLRRAVNLLL